MEDYQTFAALNQTKSNMNSTKSIAALFDFDGVVVDTEPQYSIFWNEQGRKYHPEIPEFGRMIKGQTLTQIYTNISLEWKTFSVKLQKI